jgi:hypothetical protein
MSNRDQRPEGSPWPISPYDTSGIDLAAFLNSFVESIDTNNLGDSRPPYTEGGGLWSKQEADGSVGVYVYTGSVDVKIGNSNGAGLDIINEIELLEWIEVNIENGVLTFNGRNPDENGNIQPAENDYTMELLGDVGLSSLTKDDYLQWNGASWENNPPKLIETELNFMGGYDVTTQPPAGPGHGDMYINNNSGTAASNWIGIAGQYVNVGNAMGYSKNHNANGDQVPEGTGGAWFLLGEVFTGGITSIGAGSGISVNNATPAAPVVSVNKTTLDAWYQEKGNYENAFAKNTAFNKNFGTSAGTVAEGNHGHSNYALSNHGHGNEYAPLNHTHPYEPAFTKNSAFNKIFGEGYDNVARGSHAHTGYAPSSHNHSAANITAGTFASSSVYTFRSGLDLGDRLNVTYIDASSVIRSKQDVIAYYTSDERLKDRIQPIESALQKVLSLRGVEYDWNDKQDIYEVGSHDYSVIAQDVETIFPELVREQANGFKGVKIEKLIAPMIEAMREMSEELRKLKTQVLELQEDLDEVNEELKGED